MISRSTIGRSRSFVALFAIALAVSAASSARAEGKVVHIFFAGGQSNAVPNYWGTGVQEALAASGKFGDFKMLRQSHSGNPIANWVSYAPDGDGLTFSRNFRYEEDFFSDDGTGALQQVVNQVKADGDIPQLGLFWFQGEQETSSDADVARWEESFMTMLSFLKADVGQDVPVSFGLSIIDSNRDDPEAAVSDEVEARVDQMRAIQAALGEKYDFGVAVDTRSYPRVDAWHIPWNDVKKAGIELGTTYANEVSVVPEPMSMSLLGLGALVLLGRRR